MKIKVLFFALLREWAKESERNVELPQGATVQHLLDQLKKEPKFPEVPLAVAVNQEEKNLSTPLRDGDEVALIPPVAGG